MDFDELRTALAARGFDDYDDSTLGARINAARAELDRMYLWPWREKSVTGTAPLTVTDLGTIEAVTNESLDYVLTGAQWRHLRDNVTDLATSGTPEFYYRASTTTVATYPTNEDTIGVQYWKVTADLSSDSDDPASPAEAHSLIVDIAAARGWRDKDNHELASAIQADVGRQISALLDQYQPGVGDSQGYYVAPGSDW